MIAGESTHTAVPPGVTVRPYLPTLGRPDSPTAGMRW